MTLSSPGDTDRLRPRSGRSGLRWWAVAVLAVAAGMWAGVGLARIARPHAGLQAPTGQVAISGQGTFDKGNAQAGPQWSLPLLSDPSRTVSLSQFRSRPVVVNFWASWCPPCREEMPALAEAARRLSGRVSFVGIDSNDQRDAAVAFAAQVGVSYPLAYDPHGIVASRYGVFGLPTTYFLSAQGRIVGRQAGAMSQARLDQLLRENFPTLGNNV